MQTKPSFDVRLYGKGSFAQMPEAWRDPWLRWRQQITSVGICAVCGEGPRGKGEKHKPTRLDPHHVVPARYIRRHVNSLLRVLKDDEYEALLVRLLFDVRNGIAICRGCHERHESAMRRIPRDRIPAAAFEFAREIGHEYVIERFYSA